MSSFHSVILKKYLDIINEFKAHAALLPGMLVSLNSDTEVLAHAVAGGNVTPVMFALEDALQGKGLDDAYAAGDQVRVWVAQRGEEVLAILADGESVSVGDALESAGNGYLRKHVVDSTGDYLFPIIAIALETMDLSGSSGEEESSGTLGLNKRIAVMVI